jgi:hypothetical protein
MSAIATASANTNTINSSFMRYNNNIRKKTSIFMDNKLASFTKNSSMKTNNSSSSLSAANFTAATNPYEYSLTDVYDDAAIIGSELEKIINNYGGDVLKDLMPKVINVLELLESLTMRKESENDELNELRMKCQSLEMEKQQRLNEKEKFEKELEEIEEKWKQETLKLINMVNKLKEENKRLNETLVEHQSSILNQLNSGPPSEQQFVIKQEELDYMKQIKEENIKLKEALRFKEREIEQKNSESEGVIFLKLFFLFMSIISLNFFFNLIKLQSQIDRLSSTVLNFRRKQILAQNQIDKMVKTKAELECKLTERDQHLTKLREKLYSKAMNNNENSSDSTANNVPQNESNSNSSKNNSTSNGEDSNLIINLNTLNESNIKSILNSNSGNKYIIYDEKDPNRPRFTRKELEKVIMEKNELTIKLDQTQDELEIVRKQ